VELDPAFWQPKFKQAKQAKLWSSIFQGKSSIRIDRQRLLTHSFENPQQKVAEVLLWGYPRDQRGLVSNQLGKLSIIDRAASNSASWPQYLSAFPPGIGISTVTKFAYFYGKTFGSCSALILDLSIVRNMQNWNETSPLGLSTSNRKQRYLSYLKCLDNTAKQVGCRPDQIEFFLFALGGCF
jgi:hypothetical protein